MKNFTFKMFMMACFIFIAGLSNAQFKFGDKSSIGQKIMVDAETGIATFVVNFNTDKGNSIWTEDSTGISIGFSKCQTNKGIKQEVFVSDAVDAEKIFNGDFKVRNWGGYENAVRMASIDSMAAIFAKHEEKYAGAGDSTKNVIWKPSACLFDVEEDNQVFGTHPGMYKKVEYGFYFKFEGTAVTSDIEFEIDTYDAGNTGATASYELIIAVSKEDSIIGQIADFYVSGSGKKVVKVAESAGVDFTGFSNQKVYVWLKTTGSGTAMAKDMFDPTIVFDNFMVEYQMPFWIKPNAGVAGNSIVDNSAMPFESAMNVETTAMIPVKTKGRLGSLQITNDLLDNTEMLLTFLETGALKANDGSGNYTEDVAYTFSAPVFDGGTMTWSKASIEVAAPEDGSVDDDMMLSVKLTPMSAAAKRARIELDCGTRIWYDFYFKGTGTTIDLTGVADQFSLNDTLPDVAGGSLILLAPGKTYNAGGYAFDKSLEFRSSDVSVMEMPHIYCDSNFDMVTDSTVDYIVFRNIKFSGVYDGDYVMNISEQSTIVDFVLESCEVKSLRSVLRIKDNPSTVENFTINNCILDSLQNYGLLTVDKEGAMVNNIMVTNSTFSRLKYFIVSKNNSNSLTINNCTFFEVPDAGRQLIRYRQGDGQNDIAEGLKIQNSIFGHGWDMDNDSTFAVKGFEGLTNTAFKIENVYATNDFAYSSDSIPGLPSMVYEGSSYDLWVDPLNGDFSYKDMDFAGIGNAGDPRWVPAVLDTLILSVGDLIPMFSSSVVDYAVVLPAGTSSVEISAKAPDGFMIDGAGEVTLMDGENKDVEVVVTTLAGKTAVYTIAIHVQSDMEILYVSGDSYGVYNSARAQDQNVYDALVDAGYSVTMEDKLALNVEDFDYSPFSGLVISAGVGSSWVNNFAKDGYPVPCVTMQPDGPRSDKWGWTGSKKNNDSGGQMMTTKSYNDSTAQFKIIDTTGNYITSIFQLDELVKWNSGDEQSDDWSGKEIKSYNLNDSIAEAIPLATIPADGSLLTTMWAVPSGASVRSLTADGYARVTLANSVVFIGLFNDGLAYATDEFGTILVRSLEWAMGTEAEAELATLVPSEGALLPAFESGKMEYQLNLPKGTSSVGLTATVVSPNATLELPEDLALTDGMTETMTVKVTSADGLTNSEYNVMVHVQADKEILYVSNSSGAYGSADSAAINIYDAMVDAGYSVTMMDKLALNSEGFNYSPYFGAVIGAGVGSSWVNNFAKDGYPIPCVTMQHDGPRKGKWGWTGTDKDNNVEMNVVKTASDTPADSAKMSITNIDHFITENYQLGDLVEWNVGNGLSEEWAGSEVKSYGLADSIPEAIALGRIPIDGSALTSWWAIPAGTSIRSLTPDGYSRVALANNVVYLGVFGNGLLYATEEFDTMLLRSLEWAVGGASDATLSSLTPSLGELAPSFDSGKTEYQLNLPMGTAEVSLSAVATSPFALLEVPEKLTLIDGMTETMTVTVTSADKSDTTMYNVMVHVQSDKEIVYISANSDGSYGAAKAFDTNVYDALVADGYSVTFAKRGALKDENTDDGVVVFDYTPFVGMVISAGEGSSNVNNYAKHGYPIPCVTMQPDGPRVDKWGWTGTKKSDGNQMYVTKSYDETSAQIVIKNNGHYITENFNVDDVVIWTTGTATSEDFLGKEVKSYNLTDSIPDAIPLATIPADGNSLTTMWAIPDGTSLRTMSDDGYVRVTTDNRIVFMSLFNDGLLYAAEGFDTLLVRSLDWVLGAGPPTSVIEFAKVQEVKVYPNPAKEYAKVRFTLTEKEKVSLSLYNLVGQKIDISTKQILTEGVNEIDIQTQKLNEGLYIYVLEIGSEIHKGKLNIVK